jgi:Putative zinc-finger
MDCPENDTLLRFVDGEPSSIDSAVQRHIDQCGRCQQEIDTIRTLDESVRKILRAGRLVSVGGEKCPDGMLLVAYLDGQLSTTERDSMERHLSCCDMCLDEIVAAAERSDLLSKNPQSLQGYVLRKALDLEQPQKPPPLPENETAFDIVLRVLEDAVELVRSWGDWVQPLPTVVPAVRGRPLASRQGGVLLEKEIGAYKVELDIEQIKTMRCQIGIKLNEKYGKPAEDVRVSLSGGEYELESYLTRQGRAAFDGIPPGEYGLTVSDRHGSVETIRLKITG